MNKKDYKNKTIKISNNGLSPTNNISVFNHSNEEIESKVAAVFASNAGFLKGAINTAVANFIFVVLEAIIVKRDSGSYHGASDGSGNFPNGYL